MRLRDPRAPTDADGRPDGSVDVNGELVEVESDGTFASERITRSWAESYAERQGATLSEVLIEESDTSETEASESDEELGTCEEVKNDGEVCGRERPCPYHD